MLMPVRKKLHGPMSESFAVVPVPLRSKWVQVEFSLIPDRPKHCTTRISIITDALLDADSVVSSAAPLLFIGDPVFFFTSLESRKGTYERALRCCEPPKYVGAFRTDLGEIASCIRVGAKHASYQLIEEPCGKDRLRLELTLLVVDEIPLGGARDLDAGRDA